jgi:tetratricopeptide (TPR) repeat protein
LDKAWLAITDFYIKQKDFQKSLYYVNKAIGIDGENPLYWRRYATINQYLNFFEEAEEGYRKAFENGDIALDNFLFWSDVLYVLGEVNAAFEILNQAKELYPNEAEILYRIVGLFYNIEEETNAIEALETALTTDFNKNYILKDAFPHVWECETVQNSIKKHTL